MTPYAYRRDTTILKALPAKSLDDVLIHPPREVLKDDGKPYTVYTPFRKRWETLPKRDVQPLDRPNFQPLEGIGSPPIASLCQLGVCGAVIDVPEAGEAVALNRLERFMSDAIYRYGDTRNRLTAYPFGDPVGTSALSPYLRFGMLSPRQAYHAAARLLDPARGRRPQSRQHLAGVGQDRGGPPVGQRRDDQAGDLLIGGILVAPHQGDGVASHQGGRIRRLEEAIQDLAQLGVRARRKVVLSPLHRRSGP